MPPATAEERAVHRRIKDASRLRRVLEHERLILQIATNRTDPLDDEDLERVRLAEKRIEKIKGALYV
jgi:hypothetical protein